MKNSRFIPITKPCFDGKEMRYIREVLDSGWVTQGKWVEELEKKFRLYAGCRYAVAVNSCTSAQMMSAGIIGLAPGDEVIVPAFTWISTASSAEHAGAVPVFADISLETFNMDPLLMEKSITRRTKAVFPVHLFGFPADMKKIMPVAKRFRLRVVEDCACSLGAFIGGKHTGSFGDCGCFSLHPRKSITTGEGGMLVTGSKEIYEAALALRNHGASRSDLKRHHGRRGFLLPGYPRIGFNFRMTDIQGAMGVAQFEKLASILEKKKRLSARYNKILSGISCLRLPVFSGGITHGLQAYVTLLAPPGIEDEGQGTIDRWHDKRNRVMGRLERKGIATRQGTHAVHIQEYYRKKYRIKPMDFPRAYAADRLSVALPLFCQMTEREQDYVAENLVREIRKEC